MRRRFEVNVAVTRPCSGHTLLTGFIQDDEFQEQLYEKYAAGVLASRIMSRLAIWLQEAESGTTDAEVLWEQLQLPTDT